MAAPVVSINFKNIIAKIRKDNLLPENVLTKAINRGIRRSLYLMSNYAKEHHAYKDWKARARWELLHRGYGKGTGITKAIHFHSEKGKRNKRIQSGILYVDLQEAPWAKYQIEGTEGTSRPKFFFGRRTNEEYSAALDVVGHEFTHAVINYVVGPNGINDTLTYNGETGALNESYADIIGSIIEGKQDDNFWKF